MFNLHNDPGILSGILQTIMGGKRILDGRDEGPILWINKLGFFHVLAMGC